MFLEATYLESPSVSPVLPVEEPLPPVQKEQSIEERYQDTPVNHLVFVIHGIGQQTEQYGHFYEHMEELRETTRQVLQAKVPDHNVRIELIPIEWHKHLHDQTDPEINKITLKSIPTIRLIENDYLADVLYYFSKSRGQCITDNVTNLFNTSYNNFMSKHPDFNGKIAIYGYSLGGIITWDILSHQRTPANDKEKEDYAKLDIIYPKLDFKPDYFFALGSPVGAILVFRNQSPLLYRPDDSIIFENIFHPFDPLAYRFEPLLIEKYTDEAAVLIERSIPIGPNFSLPSLPSFPGSSLLSMFSRFTFSSGVSADPAESTKQLLEASDEAVTQNHQTTGYWKWFTEYFAGQNPHEDDKKHSRAIDGSNGELNGDEEDNNNGSTTRAHDGDVTAFDGFEGPRVIDCTDNDEDVFDEEVSTKWAGGVLSGKYDFTGPLKPRRMGSRLNKNGILTSGMMTAGMIPEKNDYFSIPKSSKTTQHTVDVLGNDGERVDNLTRAKNVHKSSQHILNQLSQDFDSPLSPTAQQEFLSNMRKGPNVTINDETSSGKDHDDAKSHISRNSNNIMDDLSKELHEPGAKVMEPRQSSESITKDATVPQEGDQDKKHSKDESEDLPSRIDFVLQPESFMDMLTNEYIVGFRAHFSYWTNKDLQWHILRRLEILDEAEDKDNE